MATSYEQRKSGDVENRVRFVFKEIPESGLQVIDDHEIADWLIPALVYVTRISMFQLVASRQSSGPGVRW